MPNWADDEGRYWYTPPGSPWWEYIQIPHPPVGDPRSGLSLSLLRGQEKEVEVSKVIEYVTLPGLELEIALYSGPKELCLRVQIAGTEDDGDPLYAGRVKTDGDPERIAIGVEKLAESLTAWCTQFSTDLPVAFSRMARMIRVRGGS